MNDVPPATPVAREISAKFNAMMRKGGRIDQILAGGQIQRSPPVAAEETERILRNLEDLVADYRSEVTTAVAWHKAWKRRQQPKGFKIKRASGEHT